MSFKSYISVEIKKPKGFYNWPENEQELFYERIAELQESAEQAYIDTVAAISFDFEFKYDIESK